jgi:hypothetical protein
MGFFGFIKDGISKMQKVAGTVSAKLLNPFSIGIPAAVGKVAGWVGLDGVKKTFDNIEQKIDNVLQTAFVNRGEIAEKVGEVLSKVGLNVIGEPVKFMGQGYKKLDEIVKSRKKLEIAQVVQEGFKYPVPIDIEGPTLLPPNPKKRETHIPGYNFCGPGTQVEARILRGDRGINALDEACRVHDVEYMKYADNNKELQKSDQRLVSAAKKIVETYNNIFKKTIAEKKIDKVKTWIPFGETIANITNDIRREVQLKPSQSEEFMYSNLVKNIFEGKGGIEVLFSKFGYKDFPKDFAGSLGSQSIEEVKKIGEQLYKIMNNKVTQEQIDVMNKYLKKQIDVQDLIKWGVKTGKDDKLIGMLKL